MKKKQYKVSFTNDQELRLEKYMTANGINNASDTIRELVDLGLRVKEQSTDDDSRTNRELIEKILERQYIQSRVLNHLYVNTYPYDEDISNEMKNESSKGLIDMAVLSEGTFTDYLEKRSEK